MFSDLKNLDLLKLHFNELDEVEPGSFCGLNALRVLYLSVNRLKFLSADAFSGLDSLKRIYLQANHFTMLQAETFNNLPRPLDLGLHDHNNDRPIDNPLQCDAQICWLKQEERLGNISFCLRQWHIRTQMRKWNKLEHLDL